MMLGRYRRYWAPAALLALLQAGCANSGFGRPRVMPGARTISSVGDRPEIVTAGSPGRSYSSGPTIVEGPRRADGRISGRVVDDRGRPVANAEVRLADGGADSGRLVRTLTDDAGGFTLNGLRPGTRYTLVAQGDQGGKPLLGREVIEPPDTRVEITALSEDARRVSRISRRNDDDEGPDADSDAFETRRRKPSAGLNEDDLPARDQHSEPPSDDISESSAAWRAAREVSQKPPPGGTEAAFETPAGLAPAAPMLTHEETNPLPPALERAEGIGPLTESPAPASDRDPLTAPTNSTQPDTQKPGDEPFTSGEGPLVSDFTTAAPAQPSAAPAAAPSEGPFPDRTETPINRDEPAAPTLDGPPPAAAPVELSKPAKVPDSPVPPIVEPQIQSSEEPPVQLENAPVPGLEAREAAPPRPTWNDLESQRQARAEASPTRSVRRTALERAEPTQSPPAAPPIQASCRYNARARRVVDFQLSDIDGNALRFSDLDADYVLLDFWGTWCNPCLKSIPHLVDLQKRFGAERVRVVGIAYEQGPLDERAAAVRRVAERMGVDYTLALAEADGKPCPLAAALNVQQYPTMILLDRQGRILWRDSGASAATLARLDRVLASTARAVR